MGPTGGRKQSRSRNVNIIFQKTLQVKQIYVVEPGKGQPRSIGMRKMNLKRVQVLVVKCVQVVFRTTR